MRRLEKLKARQQKLMERKEDLMKRAEESKDVDEVRSIYERLTETADDLKDIAEEIKDLESEGEGNNKDEGEGNPKGTGQNEDGQRSNIQTGEMRNAGIVGAFRSKRPDTQLETDDPTEKREYKKAFVDFVCRGTPIPTELRVPIKREASVTETTDVGAVIPTTLVREIIQKLESYGNIYAKITKTNVKGGMAIPILSFKPEAKWVGEKSSDDQKLEANEKITFSYYGVECKIAQSLLTSIVTIEEFQKKFVPLATEAIVKAIEVAIIKGSGSEKPLGIINDPRVKTVVTMAPEDMTWNGWHRMKAKIKKSYRKGCFIMAQSTFDEKIDGMEDKNGQPVGRTNYGVNGEETYRFMGKDVETVEEELLPCYEDAAVGDVFAIFGDLKDYVVNSNLEMQVVKWIDHDTNEVKNKVIMIVDGKIADANGFILIKKGKSKTSSSTTPDKSEEPTG